MDDFRACLSDCQLYDLGYVGNKFTWCNRRDAPATVRVRLDRACATTDWHHRFPNSRVMTDVARGSDHSPLIFHLEDKSHFGHVRRRVKELEERLIELDKEPITCFTRQRQEFMRRELEELLSREKFYGSSLERRNGSGRHPSSEDIDAVIGGMETGVNDVMNESLNQPFSPDEVKHAIFQMLITDNVLVAYEINHYLAHKYGGSVGHAALKLDLSKTYDRVEWNFLERVLVKLGFHPDFISLILISVSTTSYSIVLLGQIFGYSHPERGLRQGDPLSPYLFLFCAEALSHLISKAEANGELRGIAISRYGPRVSHLLFADDTLIFGQATSEALHCVGRVLKLFEKASGLTVNLEKSSMAFSRNISNAHSLALANILSVESWRCKNLSQAGKVVLLKTVVQSIPVYAMSYFQVPFSTCHELEGLMADFLWHNKGGRRIHWLAWNKLCAKKVEGGLGFRKMSAFNQAMLAKQLWRVISKSNNLLSRIWKQRNFPTSDIFEARVAAGCSFTWRSVLATRNLIASDVVVILNIPVVACYGGILRITAVIRFVVVTISCSKVLSLGSFRTVRVRRLPNQLAGILFGQQWFHPRSVYSPGRLAGIFFLRPLICSKGPPTLGEAVHGVDWSLRTFYIRCCNVILPGWFGHYLTFLGGVAIAITRIRRCGFVGYTTIWMQLLLVALFSSAGPSGELFNWVLGNVIKPGPDRPVRPVRPGTGSKAGPREEEENGGEGGEKKGIGGGGGEEEEGK
ncbi:UNVERIFIED_CONTAM: putative mitochondrial protein [Sesamum radiatum]|uniref:Mitochondrial protein n=1 Tax=Sesamum radiatum TaxID=300843 RepID=A0AAW2TXM5_SESRA